MSFRTTMLMMILVLSISAFAQTKKEKKSGVAALTATQDCFATFNDKLPNFCVTVNGNIENFFFPAGISQIYTDGYGICDFTGPQVSYYDDGDQDSGNWLDPVVSEPHGPNTFPLTITRTTADGLWTIKQSFSRNVADVYVKDVITWTNNSGVEKFVYFTRYVDIDADGSSSTNWFDGSATAGWGYAPASIQASHGLTVRSNLSINNYLGFVTSFSDTQGGNHDPCSFVSNTTPSQGDQALMYAWVPGGNFTVPARGKITQTLEYRPM